MCSQLVASFSSLVCSIRNQTGVVLMNCVCFSLFILYILEEKIRLSWFSLIAYWQMHPGFLDTFGHVLDVLLILPLFCWRLSFHRLQTATATRTSTKQHQFRYEMTFCSISTGNWITRTSGIATACYSFSFFLPFYVSRCVAVLPFSICLTLTETADERKKMYMFWWRVCAHGTETCRFFCNHLCMFFFI